MVGGKIILCLISVVTLVSALPQLNYQSKQSLNWIKFNFHNFNQLISLFNKELNYPCTNGGLRVQLPSGKLACNCRSGTYGKFCENRNLIIVVWKSSYSLSILSTMIKN